MDITRSEEEEQTFTDDKVFGVDLEPWSFTRRSAADLLGIRYGNLFEEEIRRDPNPLFERLRVARVQIRGANGAKKKQLAEEIENLKDAPEHIVTWPGMLRDAAIVLWLRSQPDSTCHRVLRKWREYDRQIDQWADENGIGSNEANTARALEIFAETITPATQNQGTPDIPDADKSRTADDPNI